MINACILLLLFISAIIKMNVQSFIYFIVIVLHLYNSCGHPQSTKTSFVMTSVSLILILRMLLIWSNIDEDMMSVQYPKQFQKKTVEFAIPWIRHLQGIKNSD